MLVVPGVKREEETEMKQHDPDQVLQQTICHNGVMQHTQNTLPDHSWIKLYVNIQVDWSGGPLNML